MAKFVTKIITADGPKQIDYNALANLPDINAKLDKVNPTGSGSLSINRKDTSDYKYVTVVGTNNTALDNVAFASGDSTEAGWRSHTEGYMTYANETSHAEGRLAKALGKGSHAEGIETYKDVKAKINGIESLSTTIAPIHIDATQFTVIGDITNTLAIGDTIVVGPTDTVIGFATTDIRKITAIEQNNSTITTNIIRDIYTITKTANTNLFQIWINDVGSNFNGLTKFDQTLPIYISYKIDNTTIVDKILSGNYTIQAETRYVGAGFHECLIEIQVIAGLSYDIPSNTTCTITSLSTLTSNMNSIITINTPFRNEFNYYEGHNVPNDGYIPAGAKLR